MLSFTPAAARQFDANQATMRLMLPPATALISAGVPPDARVRREFRQVTVQDAQLIWALSPFVLMYGSTGTTPTGQTGSPFHTSGRTVGDLIRTALKSSALFWAIICGPISATLAMGF
jgi:hypothetical protein